jgi:hypothetical protein
MARLCAAVACPRIPAAVLPAHGHRCPPMPAYAHPLPNYCPPTACLPPAYRLPTACPSPPLVRQAPLSQLLPAAPSSRLPPTTNNNNNQQQQPTTNNNNNKNTPITPTTPTTHQCHQLHHPPPMTPSTPPSPLPLPHPRTVHSQTSAIVHGSPPAPPLEMTCNVSCHATIPFYSYTCLLFSLSNDYTCSVSC